jgi:hypothetical protein
MLKEIRTRVSLASRSGRLAAGALAVAFVAACAVAAPVALPWLSPALLLLLLFAIGLSEPALEYIERLRSRFASRRARPASFRTPRLAFVTAFRVRLAVPGISARPPPAPALNFL